MADGLGILLLSGDYRRAHFAFVLATGAAAIGRAVVMMASAHGSRALMRDWSALDGAAQDAATRGVARFAELRDAARDLQVRMILCEASTILEGTDISQVIDGVEVAGVASFLEATRGFQLVSI